MQCEHAPTNMSSISNSVIMRQRLLKLVYLLIIFSLK